jgi:hypothetical protein
LAAAASAASGEQLTALEDALGCSSSEASVLLALFLEAPPPALHSALALWVRSDDFSSKLVAWSSMLPSQVSRGSIPTQPEADTWADRNTLGLIKRFPLKIDELTRLILTSALATKVSWETPFEAVPASEFLPTSSPWFGLVERVLLDTVGERNMVANTAAAGTVAVHFAQAVEELVVVSVSADPSVDRSRVFDAAYDIARLCRDDKLESARCKLFGLPLGRGHSWDITEEEVLAFEPGNHEAVVSSVLPAWSITSRLDLNVSDRFGVDPAIDALLDLIGRSPGGDLTQAVQSAVASYTPVGFDAAAISTFWLAAGRPSQRALRRSAALCFDHPFAAVAISASNRDFGRTYSGHTESFGLPLFSAWIANPNEADEGATSGTTPP